MTENSKPWEVLVHFRCRRERLQGIKALDVEQKIAKGKAICPFKEKVKLLSVSSPADNRAGREAAEKFKQKCPLCGIAPEWIDFDIE